MSSKTFLLLAISAMVLFISSEVAARDLAETTTQTTGVTEASATETNGVDDAKYGGYGGGYPGRGGGYGGSPGGRYGGYPGGGYGGGYGGGCRYGRCCHYGRCRCCNYAGEATEAEPKN